MGRMHFPAFPLQPEIEVLLGIPDQIAGRRGVDLRSPGGDHPDVLEPSQPTLHRGPGDLGDPGQLHVTDAGVRVQAAEQGEVEVVDDVAPGLCHGPRVVDLSSRWGETPAQVGVMPSHR